MPNPSKKKGVGKDTAGLFTESSASVTSFLSGFLALLEADDPLGAEGLLFLLETDGWITKK